PVEIDEPGRQAHPSWNARSSQRFASDPRDVWRHQGMPCRSSPWTRARRSAAIDYWNYPTPRHGSPALLICTTCGTTVSRKPILPDGFSRCLQYYRPDRLIHAETNAMDQQDRFRGCLLGLACGDAVGTTVEFCARGSFPLVTDMVGGGVFNLK